MLLAAPTAQALADTLGVRCCDRMILQEVARRAHVDVELVRRLDERVSNIGSDWWKTIFREKSYSKERYLHHLVKVILNISKKGGVIVGRGAHLILGPERCFRVRIVHDEMMVMGASSALRKKKHGRNRSNCSMMFSTLPTTWTAL